jgi:hypothetical protein
MHFEDIIPSLRIDFRNLSNDSRKQKKPYTYILCIFSLRPFRSEGLESRAIMLGLGVAADTLLDPGSGLPKHLQPLGTAFLPPPVNKGVFLEIQLQQTGLGGFLSVGSGVVDSTL